MSDTQRDREERQHVIEVLQNMVDWMEAANYIVATPERIHALGYAIASIKTDLRYDLLYEETSGQADKPTTKNDVPDINVGKIESTTKDYLGVDCISRAQAQTKIEMNASRYTISKERGGMGQVEWSDQLIKVSDAVDIIRHLSPVTPQFSSELDKNSKKLENPITKNDLGVDYLGVDCISRKSIKQKLQEHHDFFVNAYGGFSNLPQNDKSRVDEITNCIAMVVNEPPVTPQEPRWIPVSERLPEEHICDDGYHEPSKSVLVQMKSGAMHTARYWSRYDERWLDLNYPTTDEVIAWMPLPSSYREVKE